MAAVYGASDVVVVTSDNEGMPLVLIEASAAGRACVTTDVGSAAEVVEDGVTGFVVPTDESALAAAVGRLLVDPGLRATYAAAARARTLSRFGMQAVTGRLEPLYGDRGAR
jgi:glycosyltransferase involved in cell wall biosynthesis